MTEKISEYVDFLNISLDNLSMDQLLPQLSQRGGLVVTPNVDHLVKLQHDPEFHQVYRHADYVVCDSKVVMMASQLLGQPLREKISGSDLFPAFYSYYANDPATEIFLLGGPPGVAVQAQQRINAKVGRPIVTDTYCPPFGFEHDDAENERIIERINASGATVLAVGVGAPKQEKWIHKYRDRLPNVKIFLAIGATINFEAGHTLRAPTWVSESGLEWMYRLLSEPKRLWKRYLVDDLPFGWFLLQQMTNRYHYQLPIGQLLLEAELLSSAQVQTVLAQQAQMQGSKFGELAAQYGWLQSETIDFFVQDYPKLQRGSLKQPLGQYLKSAALMDDGQIQTILQEQSLCGDRFGELAVQKGWVPSGTVSLLLEPARRQRRHTVERSPLSQNSVATVNV
ncbi:MAG: WecB/TagA/CpsF family glycosyltransferase [Leptolyngbyaceae cyanobacterium]